MRRSLVAGHAYGIFTLLARLKHMVIPRSVSQRRQCRQRSIGDDETADKVMMTHFHAPRAKDCCSAGRGMAEARLPMVDIATEIFVPAGYTPRFPQHRVASAQKAANTSPPSRASAFAVGPLSVRHFNNDAICFWRHRPLCGHIFAPGCFDRCCIPGLTCRDVIRIISPVSYCRHDSL